MTLEAEAKFNQARDQAYLNAAIPVWSGSAKSFSTGYQSIQPLYNGTSFQKKYYPKQYEAFIKTLNQN